MRKRIVSALMMTLALLAGCGARATKPEDVFASFREELCGAERVTASLSLTADYGGTAAEYGLDAVRDGGTTTVTVTEPEMLRGVTAAMTADDTALSFDGVILAVGPVDGEGHTPLSAVPAIFAAMEDGYAELTWRDGGLAAARYYVGETTRCTVWLDPETLSPVAAELSEDGRTVLTCRFTAWEP